MQAGTGDEERGHSRNFERATAIYIAIVAVILAVASVGGDNAAKDAQRANLGATNLWAFFQAKNIRRTEYQLAADELERRLLASDVSSAERGLIEKQLADYRQRIAVFTSDKQRMEGLDELWERAKALEAERDDALKRDPYFDTGQALLQIAIVLASVAIITEGSLALTLSVIVAVLGSLAALNGFTLVIDTAPLATDWFAAFGEMLKSRARP